MNVKYITFTGKHPAEKKENRRYLNTPPKRGDYGASYSPEYMKVDIDDFNHKTGELENPIHGKARSETIVAILDAQGIKYNGIITEHGKHLFFRVPEGLEKKNKNPRWLMPPGNFAACNANPDQDVDTVSSRAIPRRVPVSALTALVCGIFVFWFSIVTVIDAAPSILPSPATMISWISPSKA